MESPSKRKKENAHKLNKYFFTWWTQWRSLVWYVGALILVICPNQRVWVSCRKKPALSTSQDMMGRNHHNALPRHMSDHTSEKLVSSDTVACCCSLAAQSWYQWFSLQPLRLVPSSPILIFCFIPWYHNITANITPKLTMINFYVQVLFHDVIIVIQNSRFDTASSPSLFGEQGIGPLCKVMDTKIKDAFGPDFARNRDSCPEPSQIHISKRFLIDFFSNNLYSLECNSYPMQSKGRIFLDLNKIIRRRCLLLELRGQSGLLETTKSLWCLTSSHRSYWFVMDVS